MLSKQVVHQYKKAEKCLYDKNGVIIGKTYSKPRKFYKSTSKKIDQDKDFELNLYKELEKYEELELDIYEESYNYSTEEMEFKQSNNIDKLIPNNEDK
ncbi:hypothetical protein F8M41_001881 [Gigaspora margarita]|uniref:Uncharacterized protein n=1 Tax=Gigaspora margarita TaxID=4874 RepID=A0A8H4A9N5_GIGMA|nr:hypothetical protein F8M41_001881 [Gigaspora margarita]